MANNLKSKTISGLIWKFSERIAAQLVTFIVSIVLARLLEPSHYGAIAIVNIFITLANVFVDSGFGSALIQKKNTDETDFSTVFYFNIAISISIYTVLYICAPYIAMFYNMEILSPVLRVLGLRLILAGVNSVQHAYVSKNMLFKRFFWATLFGTAVSAVAGIVLAYKGFGIWALVAQYMTNTAVNTIVLWFTVKWHPVCKFSFRRLKGLFTFGWKILVSSLINTLYEELRSLIIGKMYHPSDLAFYNKGRSFPNLVVKNINSSIQGVLFPAMASSQDKKDQIKAMTRRSIRISSYVMLPLMCGLAIVAEPFVKLFLTDKWLPCVPYLQIGCFVMAFMPIHTANLQAIMAIGRSDIFLKLEIIKKVFGVVILLAVVRFGVLAIAFSGMFATVVSTMINAFPNRKLIGYKYIEQVKDLFNGIVPLTTMAFSVWCIRFTNLSPFWMLFVQVAAGILVYIFISYSTKNESFKYILDIIYKKKRSK